jgi:hypothetical protein
MEPGAHGVAADRDHERENPHNGKADPETPFGKARSARRDRRAGRIVHCPSNAESHTEYTTLTHPSNGWKVKPFSLLK